MTLTTDPEPHFEHIDRACALGDLLLRAIFTPGPTDQKAPLATLADMVQDLRVQRQKRLGKGVFVVFEGETSIENANFTARRDVEEFSVGFDAFDKKPVRTAFRSPTERFLVALNLSLPDGASRGFQKVGDVVYGVDSVTLKPFYSFSIVGNAVGMTLSKVPDSFGVAAAALADRLQRCDYLGTPSRLLATSLDEDADKLEAFISAWTALEVFVNKLFKEHYHPEWQNLLANGVPTSAKKNARPNQRSDEGQI